MSKKFRFWFVLFALIFSGSVLAYPLVTVKNNSDYTASGTVKYADLGFLGLSLCTNDHYSVGAEKKWTAPSRGECLVTEITGSLAGPSKHGEDTSVVRYTSTGTGYAKFRLEAYGESYRIFSESEWAKESDTKKDKSPGFYFINKTDWPIAFSLDQAGCLYYGIVPKGGAVKRNTGAFWFTLRVHIQADGINPQTDWDCAEPVVEIVADVAIGAMTGGAGEPAVAALKVVAKAAIKSAVKAAVKSTAKNAFKQMMDDMIDLSGRVNMPGQFAGYEWRFRCANMPTYEITNGPGLTKNSLGDIFLFGGDALTVTKINNCGNGMMLASPTSASAIQPFVPPVALVETMEPGPPEPIPADLVLQRAALLALYNSTNGGAWFRSTGWLQGVGTECSWAGIVCNAQGRVTSINLGANNLEGALPSQIGDLVNLQFLDLGSNKIGGALPSSLGNLPQEIIDLAIAELTFDSALAPLSAAVDQDDGGFKFSFGNVQGNVAGTVTGIIRGLANDWNGQAATSIELVSWPAGLTGTIPAELDVVKWSGTYDNSFNVVDGQIVSAAVASIQTGRAFMLDRTLNTNCCGNINNLLTFDSGAHTTGVIAGTAGITFGAILPPFRFSFDNVQGNVSGTVSGIISGLVDNQAGQKATSIELLS